MKLTLSALLVGLCLAAVAQAGTILGPEPFEYVGEDFASGIVDPETEGLFYGMYWILKGSLKTVLGMRCTVKEVGNVVNASNTFLTKTETCGGDVSAQVKALIGTVNKIVSTSKGFSTINTTYCLKESDNHSGWKCFWKMLASSITLTNELKNAVSQIVKLPTTGAGTSTCLNSAVFELSFYYTQFPAQVKACKSIKS
ncbi:uncharacterized protein LOC115631380 [Scaptodrosophila lebanonensis]|uniref:Uncharacterized protein LOC115631380 n=1 Tax=Drosophila lebanonensis TaxID=7225 RepID=A0A6J2U9U3_DROLE|nr:uncharacterized protein LOC115631380 [Scaptodrosophila lebanonensis]